MSPRLLTRRQLTLRAIPAALGLGALAALGHVFLWDPALRQARAILAAFPDARALAPTGQRILAEDPIRPRLSDLVHQIAKGWPDPHSLSTAQIADLLRATIEQDHALGQVQTIDGWDLANTEAHLCVLALVTR